jgi:hypothetical protein
VLRVKSDEGGGKVEGGKIEVEGVEGDVEVGELVGSDL